MFVMVEPEEQGIFDLPPLQVRLVAVQAALAVCGQGGPDGGGLPLPLSEPQAVRARQTVESRTINV